MTIWSMRQMKNTGILFNADELVIRPVSENEIGSTLKVYRQVEDFLSLGPMPTASLKMVLADIAHLKQKRASIVVSGIEQMFR